MALGHGLWKKGDGAIIDGFGPDGLGVDDAASLVSAPAGCRPAISITTPSRC